MTPTRALIEAAEAYVKDVDGTGYLPKTRHSLWEAISSAKAAEEEVETKWRVDFKHRYLGNPNESSWNIGIGNAVDDLDAQEEVLLENPTVGAIRRVRRDTYTTVVEVREKEGL